MANSIDAKACRIYFEALLNDTGCFMSTSVKPIIISTIEYLKKAEECGQ